MARFKRNQEVVCVNADWYDLNSQQSTPYGPQKDQLVHVNVYSNEHGGKFCCFHEFPELDENGEGHYYHEDNFEPVIPAATIEELFATEPLAV